MTNMLQQLSTPFSDIQHLTVIGAGVVEYRDNHYYVKAPIARYLEELARYFDSVTFVSHLSPTHLYQTKLNSEVVTLLTWSYKPPPPRLGAFFQATKHSRAHNAVLLFVPQTPVLPVIPFLRMRASRFIVYVAGDWIEIADELRGQGKTWRVPLDNFAATLPIRLADHVIVRGPKILNQVCALNSKATLSLPIILPQGAPLRTDTCQGETITILYVGKLLRGKGVGILLQAFAGLCQRQPALVARLRLCILGSGRDADEFKAQAKQLGIQNTVVFRGYIDNPDDLNQAFLAADILVVPSIDSEGLPRVIEEGFLYRLPVIATCTGGIPYAYQDKEDLLLIPRDDVASLVDALHELIDNPQLRHRIIANTKNKALDLLGGMTAARQHAEIILNTGQGENY